MTTALKRMIHVGCREIGLDGDARHDLQLLVTGKDSLTDMSEAELKAVVSALEARGFRAHKGKRSRPLAPRSDLRYIHVLWGLLGKAGKLQKPGRAGLNAFVRSRFEGHWQSVPIDIDSLQRTDQINDVTRALKDWCRREGIATERTVRK
ncbi:regulatory protein GemA [Oceaniglobus trochenteri]|uniref:regulatory protein GemA n=1 Tax=Oceaniglobus trochenteri TaxID=2763260 RepID=UPI001CFF643F|nr:regulatory protein GemA [Oceaniglobus trochenteri]